MSEEIKEILDNFEKYEARYRLRNETQFIITHREIQILLDYITNLQEENKKLKELCDKYEEEHNNEFQCWKRDRKELLDKRDRINKAVELLLDKYVRGLLSDNEVNNIVKILKGDNK